jgi:hypothetical protein
MRIHTNRHTFNNTTRCVACAAVSWHDGSFSAAAEKQWGVLCYGVPAPRAVLRAPYTRVDANPPRPIHPLLRVPLGPAGEVPYLEGMGCASLALRICILVVSAGELPADVACAAYAEIVD